MTQDELGTLLPKLDATGWAAVDTEADSLHAYPEKLCLIQVSLEGHDTLVDPLGGFDLAPFLERLRNKELILHGADYDLRLLYRTFGFVPEKVFDTMWAARLVGEREFGLRDLVRKHLGISLEKGPQKMNWGMRPLTERMASYARNDTRYLRPLSDLLKTRLREMGRSAWLEEVCVRVIQDTCKPRSEKRDGQWRIKGSDRLEPRAMAILRELWHWREEEALAACKPPYFIMSHEGLVAVATAVAHGRPVTHLVPRSVPPRRAARLASAIERGLKVPPSEYPDRRTPTGVRLNREQQHAFEEFKKVRDARAHELELDPTVIASKGDLILLAKNGHGNNTGLMDWQHKLLI